MIIDMNVGVFGYSGSLSDEKINRVSGLALEVGKTIAQYGHTLYTGGRDGIMELVSRGAKEMRGRVVGILPDGEVGNMYLDTRIDTGMDFTMRSLILVKSIDFVISIGGEVGTLFEIISAYCYEKPVILFEGTGGWTDRIDKVLIDKKYLDNRKLIEVKKVKSIEELREYLEVINDKM
ncbi:MAG: hypothetical protein PWQ77_1095 [Kosmotogales bacterium]|nr:hypothetical protein [Kosmotogales bacterium]